MKTFYNEFDPFAANWLAQLQRKYLISPGFIQEKSIADIKAKELQGFGRAHFFAGIGGWDYALKLAGWPEEAEVWTGSCPCQPFSDAGKRLGTADERHLFPTWLRLIEDCRPPVIFGEQVASAAGREWLDGVRAGLEGLGYGVGGADMCAAGFGAPHIRQRLYWMAYTTKPGRQGRQFRSGKAGASADAPKQVQQPQRHGAALGLVEPQRLGALRAPGDRPGSKGSIQGARRPDARPDEAGNAGAHGRLDHGQRLGRAAQRDHHQGDDRHKPDSAGQVRRLAHTAGGRSEEPQSRHLQGHRSTQGKGRTQANGVAGFDRQHSPWSRYYLIPCSDGKTRRVGSGLFPLADGVPKRVGKLRGAGNAIVPVQAATFVRVCMEFLGMVP